MNGRCMFFDDKMEAVKRHSKTKVAADILMYVMAKAVQEVKDDAPENKLLPECKVPSIQGGKWTASWVLSTHYYTLNLFIIWQAQTQNLFYQAEVA